MPVKPMLEISKFHICFFVSFYFPFFFVASYEIFTRFYFIFVFRVVMRTTVFAEDDKTLEDEKVVEAAKAPATAAATLQDQAHNRELNQNKQGAKIVFDSIENWLVSKYGV